LTAIQKVLAEAGKTLTDLKGLGVTVGIGRFTATRIAVTAGNTMAYALSIPIVGMTKMDYEDFMKKIKEVPTGQYVSAKYSGEAHIGKKKQ
jgi:tRNA A37 threonylcarbamoyladenosine modification protein TsaB